MVHSVQQENLIVFPILALLPSSFQASVTPAPAAPNGPTNLNFGITYSVSKSGQRHNFFLKHDHSPFLTLLAHVKKR